VEGVVPFHQTVLDCAFSMEMAQAVSTARVPESAQPQAQSHTLALTCWHTTGRNLDNETLLSL
jgi:hypothetical protein